MNTTQKPYSVSCERNREPILAAMQPLLTGLTGTLLEIGSGTGQHAVYFAPEFPEINWQPSDIAENLQGIETWRKDNIAGNILPSILLDVSQLAWPVDKVQIVFTANTLHIISWSEVGDFFRGVGEVLVEQGLCVIYGPFNYNGAYTSESNAQFDIWLKERDPQSAIRDFAAINACAESNGLKLFQDAAMPANNRFLVFRKVGHG